MKVDYVAHMGDDLMVVNAARVSFAKESDKFSDKDDKLINYLAKHGHWTPFAHPQITLRIQAPVFVRAQLFKHKVGFTENEVSRRYVDDEPMFFMPDAWRGKPTDGAKQGSSGEVGGQLNKHNRYVDLLEACLWEYNTLLAEGVAPEQARMVLPQSMYTEWYWTGSLAAYARMCKQRLDSHAQKETQEIAKQIRDIIRPLYPVSWEALIG